METKNKNSNGNNEPSLSGKVGGTKKEWTLEDVLGAEQAAEKEIIGAVYPIDPREEAALWEDSSILHPAIQTEWLDHFIAFEWALTKVQAGWIPATPRLEWRLELPRYFFEDMQHVMALRERRCEYAKSASPKPLTSRLSAFLATVTEADSAASFYHQLFGVLKPALLAAYREYYDLCDPVADAPTRYILERVIFEKNRQLEQTRALFQAEPLEPENTADAEAYVGHMAACLEALGTLTPRYAQEGPEFPVNPITNPAGPAPDKECHDPAMRLTEKFPENTSECSLHGSLREVIYHMANEWQVVAPMCYAYYELERMPLEFFADLSRHIWDECRHAQIGHRRLKELGFSQSDFIWPAPQNRPESVQDYMAMLTLVGEACSFKRKQSSIIPFLRAGDHRSALLPSIDCVDERQHVGYGAKWVPEIFKRYANDERPLREIATDVRSKVLAERKILSEDTTSRRQVSSRLPLFCSAFEFSNLNFTKY